MHLGFVGTGHMGNAFAQKLIQAGHELTVFDVRPEATANLLEMGAHSADSPAAVAAATEAVFASLAIVSVIEQVVFHPETGVLAGMKPGGTFVDMSTSPLSLTLKIAAAFRKKGLTALDAPVTNRGVYVTVGGDKAAFERLRPAFEAISEYVLYMGEAGQGQVAKHVRQYVGHGTFWLAMEAIIIGSKAGADVEAVAKYMGMSTGMGSRTEERMGRIARRDFEGPETAIGTLDIVAKDIKLAVELARDVQAPATIGLPILDILERAQAQGWGAHESYIAVKVLEQMAGSELAAPVVALGSSPKSS